MLPLVCLCLALLWLRPRLVASWMVVAPLTPDLALAVLFSGLAVLLPLALAARLA